MKARDFCFWLQGYFELNGLGPRPSEPHTYDDLKSYQVDVIKKHLDLVFKHEIDPSMGDQRHQEELNHIHDPTATMRC